MGPATYASYVVRPEYRPDNTPSPIISQATAYFDGSDAAVVSNPAGNELSFGNGSTDNAFTVSAWVKVTDGTAFHTIVHKGANHATTKVEYQLVLKWTSPGYQLRWKVVDDSIGSCYLQTVTADDVITRDTWHHIVAIYDGNGNISGGDATTCMTIYVDGISLSLTDNSSNGASYIAMEQTGENFYMGVREAGN